MCPGKILGTDQWCLPDSREGMTTAPVKKQRFAPFPSSPSNTPHPPMVFQGPNGTEELMADGRGALPVGSILQSTV